MLVTNYFAATDVVVTGSDPEAADYDNPRGYIHGSAAYVYAETTRGDRRRLWVATDRSDAVALAKAERVADALNTRLQVRGKLPVAFDRWEDARPAYGSDAYIAYGQEDEVALERREAEEEA